MYLENGMTNRGSVKVLSEKNMAFRKLSSVCFSGQFHPVDCSDQLLGSMGHGNIIVFALPDFLQKICTKGFIPVADLFCRIRQGIPQIAGATFLHMGIGRIQMSRLGSRWGQSGKGKDLIGVVEPGEIPDFRQDYRPHAVTDARDAGKGRLILFHDRLDGSFNLIDLLCHHLYQYRWCASIP